MISFLKRLVGVAFKEGGCNTVLICHPKYYPTHISW